MESITDVVASVGVDGRIADKTQFLFKLNEDGVVVKGSGTLAVVDEDEMQVFSNEDEVMVLLMMRGDTAAKVVVVAAGVGVVVKPLGGRWPKVVVFCFNDSSFYKNCLIMLVLEICELISICKFLVFV